MNNYDYKSMIAGVWLDLDDPDIHRPRLDLIMQRCGDVGQELHNDLQNTAFGWSVSSVTIAVNNYATRYLVPAPNYGKAIRLSATPRSNLDLRPFDIDIVNRQTVHAFSSGGYVPGSSWNFSGIWFAGDTVAIVEFENGNAYVEFFGAIDADNYDYKLWYDVGRINDSQLTDLFLPQAQAFHPYARLKISLGLIGYCCWGRLTVDDKEKDLKTMRQARQDLRGDLMLQVASNKPSWDIFKLSGVEGGDERALGYGDWAESWGAN